MARSLRCSWRELVAKVHRQADIFQHGQSGQELEELKNDAQVGATPDG